MDFLEKLNHLMKKNNLNKRTLSKVCDIPYTTITNWYTRGYEGLTVTSLKKLSNYFHISLDYWVYDEIESTNFSASSNTVSSEELEHIKKYRLLDQRGQEAVDNVLEHEYRAAVEKDTVFSKKQA